MNLLDFISKTKGIEYLIAIAFLFVFIAVWLLINHQRKNLVFRIVPVIVLALVFSGLAYTCTGPGVRPVTAELNNQAPLLASPVLIEKYGPASFNHDLHRNVVKDCTVCHHNSGNEIQPCKSCHSDSSSSKDLNKPSPAQVYHLRCISCHTENQAGPTDCTGCHTQAFIAPLSITHPLTGNDNCLTCHNAGFTGVPHVPADHTGAFSGSCQLCHSPAAQPTAIVIHVTPHLLPGTDNCFMCHRDGINGAAKVPADHAGRANDTCQLCHKFVKDGLIK